MAYARTIIEQPEVSAILDSEIKAFPRLKELFDGLKWRLSRQPEAGYAVSGTSPPVFVVRSQLWPGFPGRLILEYRSTENEVTIIKAKLERPPDDPKKAAKAVDRVIEETKGTGPSDDPNVAAKEAVKRLTEDN